jgi:hypothetical protein
MNYQAFTNDSLTMMYEGIRTRGRHCDGHGSISRIPPNSSA